MVNYYASEHTTITALAEEYDTDIVDLVETLEREFGVELSEDQLLDVETIGDLCVVVDQACLELDVDSE